MQVRDAMTRRVTTVTPNTTVTAALRLLYVQRIRHLPVVEDGRLVGIVSDRDLTPAARSAPSAAIRKRLVADVMTPAARWVRPDDELFDATRQMLSWRISALPVVEHDQLVGILTTTDCLRAMVQPAERSGGVAQPQTPTPTQPGGATS